MNRLFVANKPAGVGSNFYLGSLKRKYGVKKAGFSGTLDPFAKGTLVIGFGSYTKLFRFLDKTPKKYRATLWLGAYSKSLDIERIESVEALEPFSQERVLEAVVSLEGEHTYTPPSFSAKQINGVRAYELARRDEAVDLKKVTSRVYSAELISYMHPFVTFEVEVSEGTYVRSLGEMVAQKLGLKSSALSYLHRLREGKFFFDDEKPLDIKESLAIKENFYKKDMQDIAYGKKLDIKNFENQEDGSYYVDCGTFLAIFTLKENIVHYELGRVEIC